jgi:hypothetical protein
VLEVSASGIFIEDTCETSTHWAAYGLMVQSPEDIPLCTTGGLCIHDYCNTNWESVLELTSEDPDRVALCVNTFRSRYADKVALDVLPGVVVAQISPWGSSTSTR